MKPQNESCSVSPLDMVLHELHPAHSLHPDVRDRLANVYNKPDRVKRKFSKQNLIQMAEQLIIVSGSKRRPFVVSGWSLLHALQVYQVEEQITCVAKWSLQKSKIRELCYLDFFIRPQLEQHDEIPQRIRAILMDKYIDDYELSELLSSDAKEPKTFFDLPIHKGNRLEKSLQLEPNAVQNLIAEAKRPLGIKKHQKLNTGQASKTSTIDGSERNQQANIDNDASSDWGDWPRPDEPW